MKKKCIIIPAIKKNAVIPDQLVKTMAGITLIQRAINISKQVVLDEDIFIITDSQEISLIAERNNISYIYKQELKFIPKNIIQELQFVIDEKAKLYRAIIIYRANTPLVEPKDISNAYAQFIKEQADILVTLKKENFRIWRKKNGTINNLISDESTEPIYIENKSFFILNSITLNKPQKDQIIISYLLNEKSIEIDGYQSWWVCEKLIARKRILFVVAGSVEIGMGHIYRSLMLAHEITDHEIFFLCTRESELAVKRITEREYNTTIQTSSLLEDVLSLEPDIVINDILDTDKHYMQALKNAGIKTVNFEDEGAGATFANYVINALYEKKNTKKQLYGHNFFCLRDEFLHSVKRTFTPIVKRVLITFGGTDLNNYTKQTLNAIVELCYNYDIKLTIVTGPGYKYKEDLIEHIEFSNFKNVQCMFATSTISSIMEKMDIAICSAGRTIFELAYMRIPTIVMATHQREDTHSFAREKNGFEYLGIMKPFDSAKLRISFRKILTNKYRRQLYDKMCTYNFEKNKIKVTNTILSLVP